ncbi:MAG: ribbon-helix-helix protein, CopG family [Candidatus Lokiarchaeota archaeon]|nr:ribbon-helix-helix protein, CopG family [Candidatus Lokiarchaeota archaeon]
MSNFKIMTINVNKRDMKILDKLVDLGAYPSRSEAMRDMLSSWLEYKLNLIREKENLNMILEELSRTQLGYKQTSQKNETKEEHSNMVKVKRLVKSEKVGKTRLNEIEHIWIPKEVAEALDSMSQKAHPK